MHMYMFLNERLKKEASKVKQTNKAKQHSMYMYMYMYFHLCRIFLSGLWKYIVGIYCTRHHAFHCFSPLSPPPPPPPPLSLSVIYLLYRVLVCSAEGHSGARQTLHHAELALLLCQHLHLGDSSQPNTLITTTILSCKLGNY